MIVILADKRLPVIVNNLEAEVPPTGVLNVLDAGVAVMVGNAVVNVAIFDSLVATYVTYPVLLTLLRMAFLKI